LQEFNVSEELSGNAIKFVSVGVQTEVMHSRSKNVVVTVVIWEELLQNIMLPVHDSFQQTLVGIFSKLACSKVTIAIQAEQTARRTNASMRCIVLLFIFLHCIALFFHIAFYF